MNKRITLPILLVAIGPVAPAGESGWAVIELPEAAAQVTICRDEWGVPHIYGLTDVSVVFAAAYAQAEGIQPRHPAPIVGA